MDYWALALLLLTLGLGLAILEVFFPSGGILGFLCIVSTVAAVVLGFKSGPGMGVLILLTAVIGLPVVVVAALNWLPETPFGRQLILKVPVSDDVLPVDEEKENLKALVGRIGQARCRMLPAGAIKIDGRTIDAVSEGMVVEEGQRVRVMQVRGNRVVVRPVDDDESPPPADTGDPLSRPIDSLGLDHPFDSDEPSSA
jgi:membrane-bound ClpP family serine protease